MGAAIDLFNDNYKQFWFQSPGLRTYAIQQSGMFLSMIITNANGDTAVYSTDATAGTYDAETIGFTLYPNPSVDILNIQYDQNKTPLELVIYDIAGRKLISSSSVINIVDTTSLTSGNYFLQVIFDDGSQGTQRFMKN
ncbi:MAG: T9SS type A sorting domain-containing protein, partial [Nonlabens sp.]|nr:T9SS type A sorting domain-containing protein [Nonlabens sp.]